jgi:hypothetical protein
MSLQIRKAERQRAKLRIGMSGPSGSGKTYSALLLARGMASAWEKVLLIDSENGSGELYSDLGAYNVLPLTAPFTPEKYIEAIEAGEQAGMEVIVIDSTSHEWDGKGGCLELNEKLASAKYKGNTWAAWSETTPRHQKFIEKITTSICHVITTARSKTDTIQTEDKKIKKVGMKDIQREGFVYELTVGFNLDREGHLAIAEKDRTGLFINRDPFLIDRKVGEEIMAWNNGGAVNPRELKRQVIAQLNRLTVELPPAMEDYGQFLKRVIPALTGLEWSEANLEAIVTALAGLDAATAQAALRPAPVVAPVEETPEIIPDPHYEPVEAEALRPEDIPFQ